MWFVVHNEEGCLGSSSKLDCKNIRLFFLYLPSCRMTSLGAAAVALLLLRLCHLPLSRLF